MRNKIKKLVSGQRLRALMELYRLDGNTGALVVGQLLNVKPNTVQMWFSRGVAPETLELLKFKLSQKLKKKKAG